MHITRQILSRLIVHEKYARLNPIELRRETWDEIVTRNMEMHIKKFPYIEASIRDAYSQVFAKNVVPSMRSLQFGGQAIEVLPNRIYNCCFLPVKSHKDFAEVMFNLLCGTGVGYSVQNMYVRKLPTVKQPESYTKTRFLIQDSIIGWADAIKVLIESYFNGTRYEFDYREIRKKGSRLVTSGGKAPGPDPLRICIEKITRLLDSKLISNKEYQLKSIDVHDILCHIADAVLAGGIRRAAMISLFDNDDVDMLNCKSGDWWKDNLQRSRANNSAVFNRHRTTYNEFHHVFEQLRNSGSGEPGVFFTNNETLGTNPCGEVSLNPYQFCNLTEINCASLPTNPHLRFSEFFKRVHAATLIGTLQASYTDFAYLRNMWKDTTELEALLGVSLTGIATLDVRDPEVQDMLKSGAELAVEVNREVARIIGINPAARITTVKPSGTSSLVLGTTSGIHAAHSKYYIRNIRVNNSEPVADFFRKTAPQLISPDQTNPNLASVISIPQYMEASVYRGTETAEEFIERVAIVTENWIKPGHIHGGNMHNVSATVTVKPDEWDRVEEIMWESRDRYTGLSILPYSDHTYVQAPFEEITEEKFLEMVQYVTEDLINNLETSIRVYEETDLTNELACAGDNCEISYV